MKATERALDDIAYGRAPSHGVGDNGGINQRVICDDGFTVSIQASPLHYAHDSSGRAPYWGLDRRTVEYTYTTFEIGNPSDLIEPIGVWPERDSGGVWAFVPRWAVEELLIRHGGAVAWEIPQKRENAR